MGCDGTAILILHLSLIITCMVAILAIPLVDIASRDSVVGRLSGKHRNLHHVGGIAGSTTIDCLVADIITVV